MLVFKMLILKKQCITVIYHKQKFSLFGSQFNFRTRFVIYEPFYEDGGKIEHIYCE